MRKMRHSLFILVTVVLCSQIFSSCTSSSKMTQAEVAEYYKDLKITGKGINTQAAKAESIAATPIVEKEESNELQPISIEVVENEVATLQENENTVITASADEAIIIEDTPTYSTASTIEKSSVLTPALEEAQEKMDVLASNNSLSKKEKRAMKKEVRQTLMKEIKVQKKVMKEAKKNGQMAAADDNQILRLILAFFLPPASVGIGRGIGSTFWLNVILTIIFWIPGVVHALIVYGEDY